VSRLNQKQWNLTKVYIQRERLEPVLHRSGCDPDIVARNRPAFFRKYTSTSAYRSAVSSVTFKTRTDGLLRNCTENAALLEYYKNRKIWRLEPDIDPTRLEPYR
jgi:hypothetical protein